MKLGLLLFLIFSISFSCAIAQQARIEPYVEAYLTDDQSQTKKAEKTFKALQNDCNVSEYQVLLNALYQYLDRNYSDRLKARILMLDVFGRTLYKLKIRPQDENKLREAIKIAHNLEDDQLLAELYALSGEVDLDNGYLLYNLKSMQLQEKIGFKYFSFVQTRFYSIAYALYRAEDYKESIRYGRKFFSLKNIAPKERDINLHILLLDIVGASYKQLKRFDSTRYYYQKIIDTLPNIKIDDPIELWEGIAKGNIGQALATQKRFKEALPLIKRHLQLSLKYQSFNNAAIAQNALANIYANQGKISAAIAGYRKAYNWANMSDKIAEKVIATAGLSSGYQLQRNIDSSFKYNALYHQYKDSLGLILNTEKLATVNSKIAFDNAQTDLETANQIISKQKLIRNFILFCIVLLTALYLLGYNWKMLKQKNRAIEIERQKDLAEAEVTQARKQITSFREHIIEKEKLIEKLQSQSANNAELTKNLSSYSLLTDEAWDRFRLEFATAYPIFFNSLKEKLGQSSPAEERLAALLFLQLSTGQIASSLGIGKDSVGRSKRRLKQKLGLPAEVTLEDYLLS